MTLTRCVTHVALLPDLMSTNLRRARALQPASWTFAVGDRLLQSEEQSLGVLQKISLAGRNWQPSKKHIQVAVTLLALAAALPLAAYYGSKSTTDVQVRSASTRVLTWYAEFEQWAKS